MNNNIPKIIHQIWLQGAENLSEKNKEKIIKTKNMHPNWKYMLWDEVMIINLIKNDNKYLNKYYKFVYLHQKVDFAKFVILKNYGGIYIDIDCDVIKNLDSIFLQINNYDLIISGLSDELDTVTNLLTCHKTKNCFNNGIIVAKPNTRVVNFLIDGFKEECSFYENKLLCIQNTTGPPIFNKLIDFYLKNYYSNDVLILPYQYFEPCINKKCNITKDTYIVHKHELSWLGNKEKKIFNVLSNVNLTYLIIIILMIIIFITIYYKNRK